MVEETAWADTIGAIWFYYFWYAGVAHFIIHKRAKDGIIKQNAIVWALCWPILLVLLVYQAVLRISYHISSKSR